MTSSKFLQAVAIMSASLAVIASGAAAGSLADPIVEADVIETVQEDSGGSLPGWVIPVAALVVVGALVAANNDDDDDDDDSDDDEGSDTSPDEIPDEVGEEIDGDIIDPK